jgi:hypothetical protein
VGKPEERVKDKKALPGLAGLQERNVKKAFNKTSQILVLRPCAKW